jgi:hypothetical protein
MSSLLLIDEDSKKSPPLQVYATTLNKWRNFDSNHNIVWILTLALGTILFTGFLIAPFTSPHLSSYDKNILRLTGGGSAAVAAIAAGIAFIHYRYLLPKQRREISVHSLVEALKESDSGTAL